MRTSLLAPALVIALAAAGCASPGSAASPGRATTGATATPTAPRSLANTRWELREYTRAGGSPVRVKERSFLRFEGDSKLNANVCNTVRVDIRMTADEIAFVAGTRITTDMMCYGEGRAIEDAFRAVARDVVAWDVEGTRLRLRNPDGGTLVYETHDAFEVPPGSRTLVEGERDGWRYRLSAIGSGKDTVLAVVAVDGAGNLQTSGHLPTPMSGEPAMVSFSEFGGATYFVVYAPLGAVRATHRSAPGAPVVELTLYDVPGSGWRAAGGFVPGHSKDSTIVTYGADGKELSRWEHRG